MHSHSHSHSLTHTHTHTHTLQGWADADRERKRPTWDAKSNKRVKQMVSNSWTQCRFDRCYFKIKGEKEARGWRFRGVSLVGTNTSALLEYGHPSDHYGLRLAWEHPAAFDNLPVGSSSGGASSFQGQGNLLGGGGGAVSRGGEALDAEVSGGKGDGASASSMRNDRRERMAKSAQVVRFS